MSKEDQVQDNENFTNRAIGAALRISFIALLFMTSFWILKPFLAPVLWGLVFAVGIYPLHKKLAKLFGNRNKLSAITIAIIGISIIVVPITMFTNSSVTSISEIVNEINEGTLSIPEPDSKIADWPIVGKAIYEAWDLTANNLTAAIVKFEPQLRELAPKLTSMIAGLAGSILLFIIAIIISSALLLVAEPGKKAADKIFQTFVGPKGADFAELSAATIRSVVQGVVGIAVIQTVFLSIGMFAIGIPAAGIISIILLIVAVIQLPTILVMLPVMIYVFSFADTTSAVIFTIWSIVWGLSDNVLKPMMLGKGIDIPMLVILLGSIGGMMFAGAVGLFLGSVILALAYKIFIAMLEED